MKKVLLLLANGFEFYEASVFIDVIGWNYLEGDRSTQLFTCGLTKNVNSTFGQQLIVDYTLGEVDLKGFDALAIPGGFSEYHFYKDAFDEEFLNVIREFNGTNKPIASICTGALPIGKSGVLAGRSGTTYHLNPIRQSMLGEFGVNVVQEPIVIDSNIITSWNPSTAMDVAFQLLEILTSLENKNEVKRLMGFQI